MRSPNHPDERDLDVALMRRSTPQMTSVKQGHGGRHGKKGLGRYLVGGLVALVLALFGGVIWFAYQDLMPGGDEAPPVIRADATPLKRDPDERGGLPLLNDESAVVKGLGEPDSPVRVERIMPRESAAPRSTADVIPEALEAEPLSDADLATADSYPLTPVSDIVVAEAAGDQASDAGNSADLGTGDSLDSLLAEIVDGQSSQSAIEPAAGPADPNTAAATMAALDDLPQPADGLALPESAVAVTAGSTAPNAAAGTAAAAAGVAANPTVTAAAPPATAQASPASPASVPGPVPGLTRGPTPGPNTTTSAAPPAPASPVATPRAAAPAETAVAALPAPALAPSFAGAYGVQLLAVRDEAAAAGAWTGLQQQHPTVLGPLRSRVQRADIGGNTFYRLQAGPFAERAGANAVCAALQARGMDCFIVEPTS